MKRFYANDLKGKQIAMWGLAFKPNTDDIREAPALYTIERLLKEGARVKVFDPEAMENVKKVFGNDIQFAKDQYEALLGSDSLAIMTEWSVFRTPSFEVIKELLKDRAIFDGRNLYDLETMKETGLYYESIGRTPVGTNR
jgi:UDPglucose 6-dehydrogenase